ncbi:unnamed protein product [Urochloa humidicola]
MGAIRPAPSPSLAPPRGAAPPCPSRPPASSPLAYPPQRMESQSDEESQQGEDCYNIATLYSNGCVPTRGLG